MSLIAVKVKELNERYLDGESIQDIAKAMAISLDEVKKFLPTGRLALAYEAVIVARRNRDAMAEKVKGTRVHNLALIRDDERCQAAMEDVDVSIKETRDALKTLQAYKKVLGGRIKDIEEVHAEIEKILEADEQNAVNAEQALLEALAEKEKEMEARREEQKKEAERLARIRRAEVMAEEAITMAAVKAAKEMVAESVGKRLERESGG